MYTSSLAMSSKLKLSLISLLEETSFQSGIITWSLNYPV
jgi:hypothetical protein